MSDLTFFAGTCEEYLLSLARWMTTLRVTSNWRGATLLLFLKKAILMVIHLIVQLLCFSLISSAAPVWPEYDSVRTYGWSLETMAKKRTFKMFEPIEIATTFRFLGKEDHFRYTGLDSAEIFCSASMDGMVVPQTGFASLCTYSLSHKGGGISPGYLQSDWIRADTVLDMSLPGTYEIGITRQAYSYPEKYQVSNREVFVDTLSSKRYKVEVLPLPVAPQASPQLRPDIVLDEPTAEERENNWQIAVFLTKGKYTRREPIRIRVVTRYLGSRSHNVQRAITGQQSLHGLLVLKDDGEPPPRTRYGIREMERSKQGSPKNASDVWNTGFTMVEEVVPNLFFDMTRSGGYRMWVTTYLFTPTGNTSLCTSNTVRVQVDLPVNPSYLREAPPFTLPFGDK